ncbi:MAG: hypothetical protein LBT83_08415 [Tannerella sp.]|nr:hypothetical protein [Tannerella sp.]
MYQEIEERMNRFFEGQTSREEEDELYRFFAQEELPAHLQPYKDLFRYFGQEMAAGWPTGKEIPLRRKNRRTLWTGIAAALLAAALSSLFFMEKTNAVNDYEGSYLIRNGVRITDPDLIRPELEATLNQVRQIQQETDLLERQLQCRYEEIISRFPDPYVQKAVRKMLETQ